MIKNNILFKINSCRAIFTVNGGNMHIDRAFKDDGLLKSLTGVSKQEFESLLPEFERVLTERFARDDRQRAIGGGRKGALKTVRHKLFFILFFLKIYPTCSLAGFIFDADRSKPCVWYNFYIEILEEVLKRKIALPKRKIRSLEEFLQAFPEAKDLFIDGTERKTQRPKNPKNQKDRYSGKKKTHTRKNTIMCNEKKRIMLVSPTKDGHLHDKRQLEKEEAINYIPKKVNIWVDTGFLGIENLIKNGNEIFMPKKKPKGGELTKEEKEENKIISSIRIVVEHAIGGMKRFRCLTDVLRSKNGIDDKFVTVCAGLWNFHLDFA